MTALIFFIIFSSIGWILLIAGFNGRRYWMNRQERERTRAAGRIVGYRDVRRAYKRSGVRHIPVVEFTADGKPYRLPCSSGFDPSAWPVGMSVEVIYDSDDPSRFHLDGEQSEAAGGRTMLAGLVWIVAVAAVAVALAGVASQRGVTFDNLFGRARTSRVSTVKERPAERTGGFRYTLDEKGFATIDGYTGSESDLSVPLLVDGHIVKGLGTSAFMNSRTLVRVSVPGNIPSIQAGAFAGCVSLREVVLFKGVQSIGMKAFVGCLSLREVTIPASVTAIADDAFPENCAATFHFAEGSPAERWCRAKGFAVETAQETTV